MEHAEQARCKTSASPELACARLILARQVCAQDSYRLVVQRYQETTMQASQILRGMLIQPRCAFTAPATVCSTSPRCGCSIRAVPHTHSAHSISQSLDLPRCRMWRTTDSHLLVAGLALQTPSTRPLSPRLCRKQLLAAATSGASADLPAKQASTSNSQG